MKTGALFGIAALVFLIATSFAPAVKGNDDGLAVFIFTDRSSYTPGDNIKVTIHVLHNGEYVDPDQTPVVVFDLGTEDMRSLEPFEGEVDGREYATTKDSKGIYKSTIPVFDSDATEGYPSIYLKPLFQTNSGSYYPEDVALTYGRSSEDDTTYDYIEANTWDGPNVQIEEETGTDTGLTLEYELKDISKCPWSPGDTVEFRIRVENDGSPVKPDLFEVMDQKDDQVPFNNPFTGVYDVTFAIPSSLKENSDQDLYARAALTGTDNISAEIEIPIPIIMLQVWLHRIEAPNATTRAFEIYVSNGDGKAVQGAKVSVGTGYSSEETHTAVTDQNGKASFVIDKDEESSYIEGYVVTGSNNQSFSADLADETDNEDWEPDPSGYGFEVEEKPNDGKDPMVMYAFNDGETMAGVTIFYYIYSDSSLISKGSVVTGSDGKFTVPGDVPEQSAHLLFVTSDGYHPGIFVSRWNDTDEDGFSDKFEDHIGSDPSNKESVPGGYKDTDGDHFGDAYEADEGTDPNSSEEFPTDLKDTDGDGFTDRFEAFSGSTSTDSESIPVGYVDTDGDFFGDVYESTQGTDPSDEDSFPSSYMDTDSDGWGDEFEESNGTLSDDPGSFPDFYFDSDGDIHDDDEESFYGTSPENSMDLPFDKYRNNTDGDSLPIDWFSSDPQYDLEEIFYGSDPNNASDYPKPMTLDSDYDTFCDNEEEFWGSNPWSSMERPNDNFTVNTDGDSLDYFDQQYDLEEIFYGTDPDNGTDYPIGYDRDSDYDDVCDAEEIFYGTSPNSYTDSPDDRPDPWDTRYSDHNSTDGKRYVRDSFYIGGSMLSELFDLDSEDVEIEIDEFNIGGRNVVKLESEGAMVMYAAVLVGDDSDLQKAIGEQEDAEWQMVEPAFGFPVYRTSDGWVGAFVMPEFLPKGDQKYTIVGGSIDEVEGIRFNHVSVENGGTATTKDNEDKISDAMLYGGICCSAIVVVAILVAIVMGVALALKGKGKKAGAGLSEE